MSNPVETHKSELASVLEFFEQELKSMRSGRASAGLVETIQVQAYGSAMELKGVASVSVPDPKTIQIEPWDKNLVKDVEKAIIAADLGMQPNTAGSVIRLVLPAMTEENRKRLVKQVNEKTEQARISLRNIREKIREEVHALEKDKKMGEDEKFRLQEQLDKQVVDWNSKIEAASKKKEEEIMTI
ncbi:ribosome recycling factor [Candidatus Uhrbacteria bacterium RIFCSPHIGHO2_12_FULL_60_25]|uniref:Ribosome-recycling factor n=1 Tax=Candidatus Uhrbacteria bacterium RIFCSPHIGHO2_12_FULL_60_25 TaxID=1802399 RepID=A0A1F7UNM1_9BACT|nr:MAG: ribosome recycling factor [Candidatus Uhrbacteria bacterium RIFCSPHIGHO2_02_FULL_60_44]OGL79287.1 MAG: ribosome recycling factor [Candidatus Uhrbacteria bacterium RIFCSPHIGHO2_12_FULL_60_25]